MAYHKTSFRIEYPMEVVEVARKQVSKVFGGMSKFLVRNARRGVLNAKC